MLTRLLNTSILVLAILIASGCSSTTYRSIDYIQNVETDLNTLISDHESLLIQPEDVLSIVVTSTNPELTSAFNLSVKAFEAGSPSDAIISTPRLIGYHVSDLGEIEFPVLGKLRVSGLDRNQLQDLISARLKSEGYLTEVSVVVEFINSKISVLGEVVRPGQYSLPNDKVNIFQALSLAGDLTIFGRRDGVYVIRENAGKRQVYLMDLTSKMVFDSPGYYLQQQDVIYVTPNNVKAGQSTVNENYLRSGGFILSLSSVALALANLLIKVLRK